VIAPLQHALGKAMVNAAKMAVDDVNETGGVNGRPLKLFVFDDQTSSTNAVRALQKAVQQNHVVAGVGVWISEVALAVEPWTGRLKTPFVVTGAISPKISRRVHEHYNKFRYTFTNNLDGVQQARNVCLSLHNDVVKPHHATRAVIMAENADWTQAVVHEYKKCLPEAGLTVEKTVRYSLDTKDFKPIFNSVTSANPQVIAAATAINGLRPIVQWHQNQVPALLTGINAQSVEGDFWDKTNGATNDVMSVVAGSINGIPVTDKTRGFFTAYKRAYGTPPPFTGYTTYDAVHMIANAIKRTGSTKGSAIVDQMEATDYTGVNGHYQFHGKNEPKTHSVKFGKQYVTGLSFQWQDGKQVATWPSKFAQGQAELPDFVKTSFNQ